jgi:poly(3-hydroxybutyrate) depolymerase
VRLPAVARIAVLALAPAAAAAGPAVEKATFESGGAARTYFLVAPPAAPADAPLLVTLHGSGHDGRSLVDKWKSFAEEKGIVLAGPSSRDPARWSSPVDGPELLRDLVRAVAAKARFDPRRVYLFGHSAGALFAIHVALLESEYFAAAAAHAGAIQAAQYGALDYARRKIPIALLIGDNDRFFSVRLVSDLRDALSARGFPVEMTAIPGHTHDYYGSAKDINRRAWEFLSKERLPADPSWREYQVASSR